MRLEKIPSCDRKARTSTNDPTNTDHRNMTILELPDEASIVVKFRRAVERL